MYMRNSKEGVIYRQGILVGRCERYAYDCESTFDFLNYILQYSNNLELTNELMAECLNCFNINHTCYYNGYKCFYNGILDDDEDEYEIIYYDKLVGWTIQRVKQNLVTNNCDTDNEESDNE